MANPFKRVDVRADAYPLFETRTELAAAGSVSSVFVDVINMLPVRMSAAGPAGLGGGNAYTARPMAGNGGGADIRHRVYWCVHAEGAGGIAAPGEIVLRGTTLDLANVGNPFGEIYTVKRVVVPGKPFRFALEGASGSNDYMLSGDFTVPCRILSVTYRNGAVAQTLFNLGVYVRAL